MLNPHRESLEPSPLVKSGALAVDGFSTEQHDAVGADLIRGASAQLWLKLTEIELAAAGASLTLLGLGLAGMGARRWRQRKA